jgi:hypothetical protein
MKAFEKNTILAELCGWTQIHNANTMEVDGMWKGYPPHGAIIGQPQLIPDFVNDLNATHEAEKHIKNYAGYIAALRNQCRIEELDMTWHATATQKTDCLIASMGLMP